MRRLFVLLLAPACLENGLSTKGGAFDPTPAIAATPGALDFGAVPLQDQSSAPLRLENVGSADLRLEDFSISGAASFAFTRPDGAPVLAPGQATELILTYQPAALDEAATLWVSSNDPATPLLPVPLTGTAAYGLLVFDPDPVDFGGMDAGDVAEEAATLSNTGTATVTVGSLAVLGESFSLLSAPALPFELAPGASAELRVGFSSPIEAAFRGSLVALSDAPARQTDAELVALVGVGDLTGRICGPDGSSWAVDARVWASGSYSGGGAWLVEARSDADGWFTLENIPSGTHLFTVEKGSWSTTFEARVGGGTNELAEPQCLDPASARVGVVTGEYDSIESILARLDIDFDAYDGQSDEYLDLLRDPDLMAEYDILFFNCGMAFSWLDYQDEIGDNLRSYVAGGGSVYASDWAYGMVELPWPDAIDFFGTDRLWDPESYASGSIAPFNGAAASFSADVLDPTMAAVLGSSTADISYDWDAWAVVQGPGSAQVLFQGDVLLWDDDFIRLTPWDGLPLALRFEAGGSVVYTTFHNESQATTDMLVALEEIILSL